MATVEDVSNQVESKDASNAEEESQSKQIITASAATNVAAKDETEPICLSEELQSAMSVQIKSDKKRPSTTNIKDCLIFALDEFDENTSSQTDPSPTSDSSEKVKDNDEHELAQIMRPIRELIYKSFNQPSEAEEGIEFVRSSLQNHTDNKDLLIRSIGHFLSFSLPPSWIDSMCNFMLDRMQLILLKFFTFKHYCSCYFNCNISDSRLFVLQCALHRRFPLLISEGCASLSRSPVFYGTKDFNVDNLSWRLLQNRLSFKSVPLHRSTHHQPTAARARKKQKKDEMMHDNIVTPLTMDLRTLEQEIERDQSKGRLPCVVIASPTDNLQKIRAICDRHGLWLHIEGGSNSMLLAAATTLPHSTRIMMQCADSITCKPFEWFKDASNNNFGKSLPKTFNLSKPSIINKGSANNINFKVTSDKKNYFGDDVAGCQSTLTFVREDLRDSPPPKSQYSDSDFVMMFPLWHCLVTRSTKQIKNRVDHSLNLCQYLKQQLLERKNIFTTMLLSASVQNVTFQISPNMNVVDLQLFKLDINSFHELLINRCHNEINNLNIEWRLYDEEDEDMNSLNMNEDRFGYYGSDDDQQAHSAQSNAVNDLTNIMPHFRFEPLSYSQPESIKNEYISEFIQKIVVEINILRKCLELRRPFQEFVGRDYDLEFVEAVRVQTVMIGLGAFRFIPSFFKNNIESESVHILNKCLCDKLNELNKDKMMTQMYKLSMDNNGIVCIVVNPCNMIFMNDAVSTIYEQIRACHSKMAYPKEVMDVMAQAIKSGINNAEAIKMEKVNQDYSVDSMVRKVPLFGSVYGWLLPDSLDDDAMDNETGVGFEIGVGIVKPTIKRTASVNQNSVEENQEEETETEHKTENSEVVQD